MQEQIALEGEENKINWLNPPHPNLLPQGGMS